MLPSVHLTPVPHGPVSSRRQAPERVRFRAGELVTLDPGRVLTIVSGVVAHRVGHVDGGEALLGLHGPGSVLVIHAEDDCNIQLMAHTEAVLTHVDWSDVAGDPAFARDLRTMLNRLEAWSSALARPTVAARLLAMLSLLADDFGQRHALGVVIDIRLTHALLASAVRATRTSVTRALLKLRQDGVLFTTASADGERLGLIAAHFEAGSADGLPSHSCHAHLRLPVRRM